MCSPGRREEDEERYLEDVISRFELSDVHPLTVDVVSVRIPAAHCYALLSKVCTFVPFFNTCDKIKYTMNQSFDLKEAFWGWESLK